VREIPGAARDVVRAGTRHPGRPGIFHNIRVPQIGRGSHVFLNTGVT